jgi:hypothetical protein
MKYKISALRVIEGGRLVRIVFFTSDVLRAFVAAN